MEKRGFKIKHNRKLFWIIIVLIILLIVLIYFIVKGGDKNEFDNELEVVECSVDSDCVKSACCHADSCVSKDKAPECDNIFCTMDCAPGTMDCGQGSCKCVNGKCNSVLQ